MDITGSGTVNHSSSMYVSAGNILPAAILFSESTQTKSLHLFKCLEMACIAERAFYYHQANYLAPSVIHVWKGLQRALLSKCRSPVIIGGMVLMELLI